MLSTLSKFQNYEEPTQNDVSGIYWKRYVFFCQKTISKSNSSATYYGNSYKIDLLFQELQQKDVLGPLCPQHWYSNVPIVETFPQKFHSRDIVICLNYGIRRKIISANDISFAPSGYGISMSLAAQDEYLNNDDIS